MLLYSNISLIIDIFVVKLTIFIVIFVKNRCRTLMGAWIEIPSSWLILNMIARWNVAPSWMRGLKFLIFIYYYIISCRTLADAWIEIVPTVYGQYGRTLVGAWIEI